MWSSVTSSMAALWVHSLAICIWCLASVQAQTEAPCPYAKYVEANEKHIMCLPDNKSCVGVASGVGKSDKDLILSLHNVVRNATAAGQLTVANGVKLPQAADMRLLVWSDELATIAQKHTDLCMLDFECFNCRSTADYVTGENLYYFYYNSQPPKSEWYQVIDSWTSGAKQMTSIDYSRNRPGAFAQIIWGLTKNIGCGFKLFRGNSVRYRFIGLYVCIYGPAGNYVDRAAYEVGAPCSDCSYGESCCASNCTTPEQYPNLCQLPKK